MIAMLIAVMLIDLPVLVVEHTVLGNFLVDITDIDPDVVADPEWRKAVRDQCRIDFDADNKNFIDSTPMGLCVFDTGKQERLSQYDCVYNTDGTWYPTEDSITAGLNEYVCCCDNNGGCFVVNAPDEAAYCVRMVASHKYRGRPVKRILVLLQRTLVVSRLHILLVPYISVV